MEFKGYIKTFGKSAITIQTEGGNQYYGPYENIVDLKIHEHLQEKLLYIPVKFIPDTTLFSGRTNYGKRYYAKEIKLDLEM